MASIQTIPVATRDELRAKVSTYAAKGFQTQRDEGSSITLSRKKPFNWPLAILCLFIPIIGWIALIFILTAAGRGAEVVEIVLDPQASSASSVPGTLSSAHRA